MSEITTRKSVWRKLFGPFLTGITSLFPIVFTITVVVWCVNFLASLLGPTTNFGQFMQSFGFNLVRNDIVAYLLGLLAVFVLIYLLGLLINIGFRKHWQLINDQIMNRIPLVKTIYDASKKIVSLIDGKDKSDVKSMSPVMCYFGGKGGTAVLALLTSKEVIEIDGNRYYSVMIPTSPIPIGGAIIYVPINWVEKVNFGIEGLMNIYVSMGVSGNEMLTKTKK